MSGLKKVGCFLLLAALLVGVFFLFTSGEPQEPEVPEAASPIVVTPARDSAPVITASLAREMMESGEPYILLDVRTEAEFSSRHIVGAILIPYTALSDRASVELPDREARILLYCQSGRRSAEAGRILLSLGYANVYDFGGIAAWPYEVVSG
ncbi:MAG: rhodanese-like domain-containing protein [Oscillospiraceae bacterium]|nr:rhodanese-like domain-containing protein [Oscillospiraceae bacterium]